MRRLFAFVVACAALAGVVDARADDTPADFSGLYLGLSAGYGFGGSGDWCSCTFLPPATDAVGGEGGIVVAGDAGYGIRLGPIVVEALTRAGYADMAFSETCTSGASCNGKLSWIAEAELSAGVVVFDNTLLAGSFGYATGDVNAQAGANPPSTALHDGAVFGARIEQGMIGGWRMGVEYRRYEMEGTNDTPSGDVKIDWSAQAVALLIHYELGD